MSVTNEKYNVTGMTCASCSAHVSKAVEKVEGVSSVSVNLLTNSMLVSYSSPASPEKIEEAVKKAGYGASLSSPSGNESSANRSTLAEEKKELEDRETPKLFRRLIVSLVLLVPLFYLSMGYMNPSWNWNIGVLGENPFYFGLTEMLISLSIILMNYPFFVSGFKSVIHGGANMDTLVALGSGVAFVYGCVVMFMMASYVGPDMDQESWTHLMSASMGLTFETAGMVPTLIMVGKTLESYSKGRTTDAIKALMDLAPKTAHVVRDGKEITIPVEEIRPEEIFVVRPGESFPVDGVVLEGKSAVNEAALTGESMPIDKEKGSKVSAATINTNGSLTCKATRIGNDTTLHQIIEMVKTASGTKTKISRLADQISGVFVPFILGIAFLVFLGWIIFGNGFVLSLNDPSVSRFSYALERAISVLVVACPCALGLATPVAIMVGSGKGAKNGILFKTASALEETGKADFVVLDKTGTLTKGEPSVTDVCAEEGVSEEELVSAAAAVEAKSEHPLARAIRNYAKDQSVSVLEAKDFKALPGHGVSAHIGGKTVYGGSISYFRQNYSLSEKLVREAERLSDQGKTPLFFAQGEKVLGVIAVADVLKEDSLEAIREFRSLGVTPIMLTGDNAKTAGAIARQLGLDAYVSDVLPDGKQAVVKKLQKYGKVVMVGDGINDAPALTQADIGMAIGAGSDIAIDSADVILMKSGLKDAAAAIRLSRHTLTNIKENLFWAFFYNLVMIPIASGVFSAAGLAKLKPWYGAAAMALSSVTVVLNALRINLYNVYNTKHDLRHKKVELPKEFFLEACPVILPEEKASEKKEENKEDSLRVFRDSVTVLVPDMMCENCVEHVTHALQGVKGVQKAEVSLETKEAKITLNEPVKEEAIEKAIQDADYQYGGEVKPVLKKKRIEVTDMMCENCVEHVQNALQSVKGVVKAEVSLEKKEAIVTLDEPVENQTLLDAVHRADYHTGSIEDL